MMPQRINERRLFGRRELAIHAWVQVGRRREACLIRNISEQGALIEFESMAPRANQMRLIVDFEDFEVDCDVRHRTENAIGLYFRPRKVELPATRGQNGTELARQVRELWQHAQLK
jgi:hypothetical protein